MIHGKYAEELIWYCYSIVSLINFSSQREEKYLLRLAGLVRDKVTVRQKNMDTSAAASVSAGPKDQGSEIVGKV